MVRRRSTQKSRAGLLHLRSGSAREIRAMNSMIGRGPVTFVLVYSPTCHHCVSYMPIWKDLCKTQGRKANMVSMQSDVYQKTSMSEKMPVSGVPTVLHVDAKGVISEAADPRNRTVMTNAVKLTTAKSNTNNNNNTPLTANSNLFNVKPTTPQISESRPLENAVIAGTMVDENPLKPIPGTPIASEMQVQTGGNPWAAFLVAARQAAPAAVLLGAYAALPKRSSGLGAPRTRRRRRS